ncbi:MAG: hypothetical protein ACO1N0_11220 [Fluviicola sp.]
MKILLGLFLLILGLIYSCYNPTDSRKSDAAVVDIDQVKDSLAKWDEIPQDSVHVVKLKEPGLYITQGFGRVDNRIRLVKLYPNRFVVLDSIQTFQEIDIYRQSKISYDSKNDWFIYSDVGSGTGDLSNTFTLVRVENNHFTELFTYSKNASVVDVEAEDKIHLPYKSVEVKELEMNREKLVLETTFESGVENTHGQNELRIKDTIIFEFSKSLNKFDLKGLMNPILKEQFWMDKKGEYLLRI